MFAELLPYTLACLAHLEGVAHVASNFVDATFLVGGGDILELGGGPRTAKYKRKSCTLVSSGSEQSSTKVILERATEPACFSVCALFSILMLTSKTFPGFRVSGSGRQPVPQTQIKNLSEIFVHGSSHPWFSVPSLHPRTHRFSFNNPSITLSSHTELFGLSRALTV